MAEIIILQIVIPMQNHCQKRYVMYFFANLNIKELNISKIVYC